jgi:hypothetical protein
MKKAKIKWALKRLILSIWSSTTNWTFYSSKYQKWRKTCKGKNKKSWEEKSRNKKKSRKRTNNVKTPKRSPKSASMPSLLKFLRRKSCTPLKRIRTRRGITFTTFLKLSALTKIRNPSHESISTHLCKWWLTSRSVKSRATANC